MYLIRSLQLVCPVAREALCQCACEEEEAELEEQAEQAELEEHTTGHKMVGILSFLLSRLPSQFCLVYCLSFAPRRFRSCHDFDMFRRFYWKQEIARN